jgi:peptidoglycan/LPS O-acetylase OafA/YrhL
MFSSPDFRPRQESFLSIQVLRGFAALAVAMVHITGYEMVEKYGLRGVLPPFRLGNSGVDLFFIISGFVIVYASEPLFERGRAMQEFFLRRAARIVPLYWFTTSIILAYLLIQYRDIRFANFSVQSVLASYFFIPYPQIGGFVAPIHGVGWTLNYEMFFYATFCFALLFSRNVGVWLLALVLAALVVAGRIWQMPHPIKFWSDPIILEFVFGMLIALALRANVRLHLVVAVLLLAFAASMFYISGIAGPHIHRFVKFGLPWAAIVATLVLVDVRVRPGLVLRALNFLGDASYSLYLIHPIAIAAPRWLFPHFVDPAASPWLYAAMLLVTAVAAAFALHLAFERPVTRYLQARIRAKFRAAPAEPRPAERAAP